MLFPTKASRRKMKQLAIVVLLALGLTVSGCGGGSSSTTATSTASGTWEAVLSGGSGEASALSFVTTFSVGSNNSLSVSNLTFLTVGTCFVSGSSASGTLSTSTNSNNVVTGNLSFTVQSGTPAGNTLTLTGTESGTSITGSWSLTGASGCTGTGSFTMTKS
jgi:hypothetical protein